MKLFKSLLLGLVLAGSASNAKASEALLIPFIPHGVCSFIVEHTFPNIQLAYSRKKANPTLKYVYEEELDKAQSTYSYWKKRSLGATALYMLYAAYSLKTQLPGLKGLSASKQLIKSLKIFLPKLYATSLLMTPYFAARGTMKAFTPDEPKEELAQ